MIFQTCIILNTLYNIEHPGLCFRSPEPCDCVGFATRRATCQKTYSPYAFVSPDRCDFGFPGAPPVVKSSSNSALCQLLTDSSDLKIDPLMEALS